MLKHISIKNYAIINELEIDFSGNLNIITGETGAGKSIMLGAMGLLLGQRADNKSLFKQQGKCTIEGVFDITGYSLDDFFDEYDIDKENLTTFRREITVEGKSRSFINDTPVTLSQLKELGEKLVDIHSQHETLSLNSQAFQLMVVDSFAAHSDLVQSFHQDYKTFKNLEQEYAQLLHANQQAQAEKDYLQFQFDELDSANLLQDEQEELEQELQTLTHAEDIKRNLTASNYLLEDAENAILNQLKECILSVTSVEKYEPKILTLLERLRSVQIELKDINSEIISIAENTQMDPNRLITVQERLDLIYRLQQKHRLASNAELIALREELSNKLLAIHTSDVKINQLKEVLEKSQEALLLKAKDLSTNRKKVFPEIEIQITEHLFQLGMPHASFKIDHSILINSEFNQYGIDQINFLFSANKGYSLSPLNKVASGGELSRLMLCIKGLTAKYTTLPTLIFDEIDTGVSGEIALKMGDLMQNFANHMQVITITHLPQIASKGNAHFFVYKEIKNEHTYTNIKKLENQDRILEIAKMLGGEQPTAIAMENAKELLGV